MNSELVGVLDRLVVFLRQYVVLSVAQAIVVALWVVHTHAFEAAHATPYLSITSAEKKSGKTRLLEVLELLVARPWFTGRISAAALVRKIAGDRPTLLLDESDAAFNGNQEYTEALRGILNSGHRHGGCASLCVGQGAKIDVKDFPVFSPKAIAGIGRLPDTVADRSIPIRLKRRTRSEQVGRFRRRDVVAVAEPLRIDIESIAGHAAPALAEAHPELPDELDDRAADGWEPLLAIADQAGGEWGARARQAALSLMGVERDDDSIGVRLLSDIRRVFDQQGCDRLPTADLIAALACDEERPWADWRGKGRISQRVLADLLRGFELRSRSIRMPDGKVPKGYLRAQFSDAFERYLPAPAAQSGVENATPPQPAWLSENDAVSIRYTPADVADGESAANSHEHADVARVAAKNPENGSGTLNGRPPLPGDDGFIAYLDEAIDNGSIPASERRAWRLRHFEIRGVAAA